MKTDTELDRCPYFHRTAVIMADGEVVTCANFYAENVGHLASESFAEVWNGDRMVSLRADFGTDKEWPQCKSCWFREIRYARQREAWHEDDATIVHQETAYSARAWNFTRFLKGA